MSKKTLALIISAITALGLLVLGLTKKGLQKTKKAVGEAIVELGGLSKYNMAAGQAKMRGLIEVSAKLGSIEDLNKMSQKELKGVQRVLELIGNGTLKIPNEPARDGKGHFIKAEAQVPATKTKKEGE